MTVHTQASRYGDSEFVVRVSQRPVFRTRKGPLIQSILERIDTQNICKPKKVGSFVGGSIIFKYRDNEFDVDIFTERTFEDTLKFLSALHVVHQHKTVLDLNYVQIRMEGTKKTKFWCSTSIYFGTYWEKSSFTVFERSWREFALKKDSTYFLNTDFDLGFRTHHFAFHIPERWRPRILDESEEDCMESLKTKLSLMCIKKMNDGCNIGDFRYGCKVAFGRVPSELESLPSWEGDYGSSKWNYRREARNAHDKEACRLRKKKLKDKARRLSRKGMRDESDISDIVDPEIMVDYIFRQDEDPLIKMYSVALKHISFLGMLSTSKSWANLGFTIVNFLSDHMSVILKHTDDILSLILPKIEPQSDDDSFLDQLRKVKETLGGLDTVPMYDMISKVFVLISIAGLMPEKLNSDNTFVRALFERWSKQLETKAQTSNVIELTIDTVTYVCEFYQHWKNGSPLDCFLPSELHRRVLNAIALADPAKTGNIVFEHWSLPEYHQEIVLLIKLVSVQMTAMRGPAALAWSRYYTELKKISFFLNSELTASRPKNPAPIIVFYGASQIGKSGVTYLTMHHLGRVFGFATDPSNIWCPQMGDNFDSGMDASKTVIIDDDVAAERKEYINGNKVTNFIRYCNVMPYRTIQADISAKGVIPFNHKVAFITTNTWHLNLPYVMSHPEAAVNRATFFEVAVRSAFSMTGKFGGPLDNSKMRDIETLDPEVHAFREYTIRMVDGMPTKLFLTGWMNTKDYLLHVTEKVRVLQNRGNKYVERLTCMGSISLCPDCLFLQDPNGMYCTCKSKRILPPLSPEETMAYDSENTVESRFVKKKGKEPVVNHVLFERITLNVRDNMYAQIAAYYLNFVPDPSEILTRWVFNPVVNNFLNNVIEYIFHFIWSVTGIGISFLLRRGSRSFLVWLWIIWLSMSIVFAYLGYLLYARLLLISWLVFSMVFIIKIKRILTFMVMEDLRERNTLIQISSISVRFGVAACGVWSVIAGLRSAWRTMMRNEGNIVSPSLEDVIERQRSPNPWKNVVPAYVPDRNTPVANMTPLQVLALVNKNTVHVTIPVAGGRAVKTNGIMICNNYILINKHAYDKCDDTKPVRLVRNSSAGGVIEAQFGVAEQVNSDLMLVSVSKAPLFHDIVHLFAREDDIKVKSHATMLSKDEFGCDMVRTLEWNYIPNAYNASYTHRGSQHLASRPTRVGDCGSPIIREMNPPYIVGYHCGGSPDDDDRMAMAFAVTQEEIKSALQAIMKRRATNESYIGPMPVRQKGIKTTMCGVEAARIESNFHPRDCVLHISKDSMREVVTPIGTIPGGRNKKHSEVLTTVLSPYLTKNGLINKWGKPRFNVTRNYAESFQKMLNPMLDIPEKELSRSIDDYLSFKDEVIKLSRAFHKQPLSWEEAINGVPGNKFIPRMDMSTASGMGLASPKSLHFYKEERDNFIIYTPKEYLMDEILEIERDLAAGFNSDCIYNAALKDEPTPLEKLKVRVFQVGCLALNVVIRKYTLPLISCLYSLPLTTELAQVINCTTYEWHQLGAHVVDWSPDQCIEGDFSSYDLKQTGQLIRAAGFILAQVGKWLGYTQKQCDIVEVIFNDISAKTLNYNGSVFHIDGVNPSGSPVTILDNGLVNSLLHRIVYFRIANRYSIIAPPFRDVVHFATVGDDSIGSSRVPWFNMAEIQFEMHILNMPYTDSSKSVNAKPFIKREAVSFCKRHFYAHPLYDYHYTAPIAVDSLLKSLHCHMVSNTSYTTIVVENASSALRELSRHPRDVWENLASIIKKSLIEADLAHEVKYFNFSYEDWANLMRDDYFCSQKEGYVPPGPESLLGSLDQGLIKQGQPSIDYDNSSSSDDDALAWLSEDSDGTDQCTTPVIDQSGITESNNNTEINTIKNMRTFNLPSMNVATTTTSNRDATYNVSSTKDVIQDFTQRPIKIYTINVTDSGDFIGADFNPWLLYFSDPIILDKIQYFKLLRADLELTFYINGNPFFMGGGLVAYTPLAGNDSVSVWGFEEAMNVQATQKPNVLIDYSESAEKTLNIPYFFYKNYFDISSREWALGGICKFIPMAPLHHINGGTGNLTVHVFCSAKNVALDMPTSLPIIVNQSDEYEKPSVIATTLSRYANMLANVPIIGSYARASSMGLKYAASVLEIFGYSKPKEVHSVMSVVQNPAGNFATCSGRDNVGLLTIDPKQEVTIDPRVVGIQNIDEMALVPLAKREAYVGHILWSPLDGSDTHLKSYRVSPIMGMFDNLGQDYYLTPMAWVTLPFKYWRGSIKFRFVVLASGMHRGRLRIAWDPNYIAASKISKYNLNYLDIIDLATTREISVTVGWGQSMTYLRHLGVEGIDWFSSSTPFDSASRFSNGGLTVSVMNRLTSPSEYSEPVRILVYASACDDFEVAVPDPTFGVNLTARSYNPPDMGYTPLPSVPSVQPAPPNPPPPIVYKSFVNKAPLGAYSVWNGTSRQGWFFVKDKGPTSRNNTYFTIPIAAGNDKCRIGLKLVFPGTKTFHISVNGGADIAYTLTSNDLPVEAIVEWDDVTDHVAEICYKPATPDYETELREIGITSRMALINNPLVDVAARCLTGLPHTSTYGVDANGIAYVETPAGTNWAYYFKNPLVLKTNKFCFNWLSNVAGGTALQTNVAQLWYTDGTTSNSKAYSVKQQSTNGPLGGIAPFSFEFDVTPGKTVEAFFIRSNSVGAMRTYGASYFTGVQDQAEIVDQSEDIENVISDSLGDVGDVPDAALIHFGEKIGSWRQVLKRPQIRTYIDDINGSPYQRTDWLTVSPTQIVPRVNVFDYVRSAYAGYRGGIRVRQFYINNTINEVVSISRLPTYVEQKVSEATDMITWAGSTVNYLALNPVVSAEIPYYSQLRFLPGRYSINPASSPITAATTDLGRETLIWRTTAYSGGNSCMETISAADDFSLFFFVSTPVLTYNG